MPRILVVDDEVEVCDFLNDFFMERRFVVDCALDGKTALAKIKVQPPDVCLLDINMPGLNGMEVLREIKRSYPSVKVIMLTANEMMEKIEEAAALGAVSYIPKPFSLEYLEKEVLEKTKHAA